MKRYGKLFLLVFLLAAVTIPVRASSSFASAQSSSLWRWEAEAVYLANLQRDAHGVPPLRWNEQLTDAARWFSWDSVANRAKFYCGHEDTRGEGPSYRILEFGYLGFGGAENAYCGSISLLNPPAIINGWMHSDGHRRNLLDPNSREIGIGYYASGDKGYATADFGVDPVYGPVVIDLEAPQTNNRGVDLYIYDNDQPGWTGFGAAQQMQVSSNVCFSGADWQPYQARASFTLPEGAPGWRSVYVRTRDALNRTRTASDVIYYGTPSDAEAMDNIQLSTTASSVDLLALDGGALPLMQFSLGWAVDDSYSNFQNPYTYAKNHVSDAAAWGGTAYKVTQSNPAWVWTTDFFHDVPLVAYVRMKVDNNSSSDVVANLSITGGEGRQIRGTDFLAAGVYQEFALPFLFESPPIDETNFLILDFQATSGQPVYVDAITFFTQPVPAQPEYTWAVPGGNYRGQGVWVRYTDAAYQNFSSINEASQHLPIIRPLPEALHVVALINEPVYIFQIALQSACASLDWGYETDAGWMLISRQGEYLRLQINPAALGLGQHAATITITPSPETGQPAFEIPFSVQVIEPKIQYGLPFSFGQ